jgi:CheY-like chemotaxis protein
VWSAEDGASALERIAELRRGDAVPDLVVLDMHMPGMDGLQLAHAIRSQPELARTRMVLLTSLGQGELSRNALSEAGISRALTKPVRQSMLFDAIAGAMGGSESIAAPTTESAAPIERAARPLVLVAEDTAVNQEVARGMLERLGYRADVVANGREAIDMVSRIPYVAVLMDMQMPEMDGLEATRVIRERTSRDARRVPIIALTANAMSGDRERCLEAGMDDYLPKPIRMSELAALLSRWAPVGIAMEVPAESSGTPTGGSTAVDDRVLAELASLAGPGMANPVPRLLQLFLTDSQRRIAALRSAAARGDAAEVQRLAHAQKGSSGTLGARELGAVAAELDEQAKQGSLQAAPELIERLESAFQRTRHEMERHIKESNSTAAA